MKLSTRAAVSLIIGVALTPTLGVLAAPPSPSSPMLFLGCDRSTLPTVNCRLSGIGFHAGEQVAIVYRVTLLGARSANGKDRQDVYRRQGRIDTQGSLGGPTLRFSIASPYRGYVIDVAVRGHSGDHAAASAASATLLITCTGSDHGQTSCTLRGRHFLARERIAIIYHVTFLDGSPALTVWRTATTDHNGSFSRPALRFTTQHSYQLDVQASGSQGDRATGRAMGIAD